MPVKSAPAVAEGDGTGRFSSPLRVGVDVGGTFTKAVAIAPEPFQLVGQAVVPTSHAGADGVMGGVAEALGTLLDGLAGDRERVELVAFSTTQAMNALLEGDVPTVGVVGLGAKPDLRRARKRTKVGSIGLAPGRELRTEHEFLDLSDGIDHEAVVAAVDRLIERGCESFAVSGAFSVEAPEHELAVAAAAAERGYPACCGHQLSEAYGLETRTVSAAVNAAILPVVERTAGLVERALERSGLNVPLLVLRGDAGAMDIESFRRRPSFTVGSGPAAGVAAALHQVGATDAIVVECGGTSTNVSVVRRGRPALRSIKVMGRPTAIRSIDSWVVGVAGGSMLRLGRRGLAGIGPRSAHVAGLPYACFADPADLVGARPAAFAPRPGDPADYAAIDTPAGRFAVTVTCAANALGCVADGTHARGSRAAAEIAFGVLAGGRRGGGGALAQAAFDAALAQIETSIVEAARSAGIPADAPLIALGGAGEALVPELSRRLGRPLVEPEHQEILASVGAALTLIRVELARSARGTDAAGRAALIHDAERACVEAGAAPGTITIETTYDPDHGLLRAVGTGAVALEAGAAGRSPAGDDQLLLIAARAFGVEADALERISATDFYVVYATRRDGALDRAVIVDRLGSVPVLEPVREVVVGSGETFLSELERAIESGSLNLGVASVLPRVTMVCGPQLLDLSDTSRSADLLAAARIAIVADGGEAVAVVSR